MKTAIAIAAAMLFLLAACSTSETVKEPHPLLGQKIPETATTIAEPSETAPAATTALSLEEYPTEALADAEEKYVSALEYIATYYRPGRSAFHSLGFRLDVRDSELKTLQTLGRRHCAELKTEYEKQIFSAPWHDRYVLPTGWHPIWTEERQGCTLRGSAVSDLKVHEMSSDELCAYTQGTLESLFPGDIIKTEGSSDRMGVYPSCRSWIFTPSENLTHSLQTLEAKADAAASEEHRIRLWSFSRQITECRKNGDTGRLCSNIEPEYQDYIDSTKRQSSPGQPETVPATTNITTIIPFPEGFTNDPPEPTEIIPFPEDFADSPPPAEIPTFPEEPTTTTTTTQAPPETVPTTTAAPKPQAILPYLISPMNIPMLPEDHPRYSEWQQIAKRAKDYWIAYHSLWLTDNCKPSTPELCAIPIPHRWEYPQGYEPTEPSVYYRIAFHLRSGDIDRAHQELDRATQARRTSIGRNCLAAREREWNSHAPEFDDPTNIDAVFAKENNLLYKGKPLPQWKLENENIPRWAQAICEYECQGGFCGITETAAAFTESTCRQIPKGHNLSDHPYDVAIRTICGDWLGTDA